jgi:hypothetical protein
MYLAIPLIDTTMSPISGACRASQSKTAVDDMPFGTLIRKSPVLTVEHSTVGHGNGAQLDRAISDESISEGGHVARRRRALLSLEVRASLATVADTHAFFIAPYLLDHGPCPLLSLIIRLVSSSSPRSTVTHASMSEVLVGTSAAAARRAVLLRALTLLVTALGPALRFDMALLVAIVALDIASLLLGFLSCGAERFILAFFALAQGASVIFIGGEAYGCGGGDVVAAYGGGGDGVDDRTATGSRGG